MKKYIGTFRKNPKGFGFVTVKDIKMEDIFISRNDLNNAIDEDEVEVEVKSITKKGIDGIITRIIKRNKKNLFAIVFKRSEKNTYLCYSASLGLDNLIEISSQKNLEIGDRLIIKIQKWNGNIKGVLFKFLSSIFDASKDIESAIAEFELRSDFPKKVKNEVKNFDITDEDLKKREDLSSLDCVTIDPETAKDFDDSISLTKDKNGNFHLGVHIADVAHFVKEGSELDKEAKLRCNSVYFPKKAIPMLPEKLSSELCSLKPSVIRLTVTVMMIIDKEGELKSYEIFRSFIKSKRRFSYEEALKTLKSKKQTPFKNLLHTMVDLMHLLKKKRFERGSIDFALKDASIIVDNSGNPIKIVVHEYDETHQMIEEFMLKANEIVALHLAKEKKALIYRVHEQPSLENFKDFYELAMSLGFKLPNKPDHKDIQNLFLEAKDTPYLQRLSINFIRNLKLAMYSPDNIGHFGLALEHYTHFTSPIRRYSDLIIARLLFDEIKEPTDLSAIAKELSNKERIAFKAESSVVLLKKYRLLKKVLKKEPNKIFEATVVKVKPFAIIFEIDDFYVEGFLHVSELFDDFYEYDEKTFKLRGTRHRKEFSFGKKIFLKIQHIDLILMQAKYKMVKSKK